MKTHPDKKWGHYLPILGLAVLVCNHANALPFTITPNPSAPFPTVMTDGTIAYASYIVTNNTSSQRNNSYVKYLPHNVSVGTGGCGSSFNLAPKGRTGDSCTLNLTITGSVNANDSNTSNHLFVCFPGGKSCAGTPTPLNISVLHDAGYNFSSVATYGTTVYTGGFNATNNGAIWQLQNWN